MSARRMGFTLVELLVVIGLIAVLTALLIASAGQAQGLARRTRCIAILRQIGAANSLYQVEFRGWHAPAYWGWSPSTPPWPANTPPAIAPSGPRRHWFQCWTISRALDAARPNSGRYSGDLICPDAALAWERGNASGYPLQLSYGVNTTQLPGIAAKGAPDYWNAWRASRVRALSEKVQFIDAVSSSVSAAGSFNATMRYFRPGWGERNEAPDKTNIVAYRHRRGANVLFFDGHAQWLPDSALCYDPATASTQLNKRQWEPKTP